MNLQIIFSKGIVAREFWSKLNVDENPVCGAMYCCLIPYWRERIGLDKMVARQVSQRGGTVYCEYYIPIICDISILLLLLSSLK